ncbi:MAG: AAA family ATPase [Burkholderiaceae bacterium]
MTIEDLRQEADRAEPIRRPNGKYEGPIISNASELLRREFDPIAWLLPGILPEGLVMLAARPKIGKSWLALQLAVATATGGKLFGRRVTRGRVLFLGLEDSERRLHSRLQRLVAPGDDLSLLDYTTEWPRGAAGAQAIAEWVEQHPDARLVVVDVLTKLRDRDAGTDTAYTKDYDDLALLKPQAPGLTVLAVHHTRKMASDDPLDTISGTLGIAGAVDAAWILQRGRGEDEAALHLVGRDLEDEGEFAVRFERANCHWEWIGEAWQVQIGEERRVVVETLTTGGPMKPAEIAAAIGKHGQTVRKTLQRMKEAGQVDAGMDGRYRVTLSGQGVTHVTGVATVTKGANNQ